MTTRKGSPASRGAPKAAASKRQLRSHVTSRFRRSKRHPYQVFADLPAEEFAALRGDIASRGVQVPVEQDEQGNTLDGHQRVRACHELGITKYPIVVRRGLTENEKIEHALSLNLKRRHLGPVEWANGFRRLAEIRGVRLGSGKGDPSGKAAGVAALASEVGVSTRTARYRLQVADVLDTHPDLAAQVDRRDMPPTRALTVAREREAASRPVPKRKEIPAEVDLRLGDFRNVLADLPTGGIDLIFTDPPYVGKDVHLYEPLGALAGRVLKPGGLLCCYVGQIYLDRAIHMLEEHLTYVWCIALIEPGQHPRVHARHVISSWRPVLVFTKAPYAPGPWYFDTFRSDEKPDKRWHPWQQALGPAVRYVEKLSKPGDLVCDPFLGSGTTAVAAVQLGRRFVGAEIDPKALRAARRRVADAAKERER